MWSNHLFVIPLIYIILNAYGGVQARYTKRADFDCKQVEKAYKNLPIIRANTCTERIDIGRNVGNQVTRNDVQNGPKIAPQRSFDRFPKNDERGSSGVIGGSEQRLIRQTVLELRKLQALKGYTKLQIEGCLKGMCQPQPTACPINDYASIDGKCNNLKEPFWGVIDEAQRRDLDAVVDDNYISARLKDRNKQPLPSVRVLSNALFKDETKDAEDTEFTIWVMAFSQLTDHDMTLTPMMEDVDESDINCCSSKFRRCQSVCLDITTSEDDPHFGYNGTSGNRQSCMNFVRSISAQCSDIRTPINEITPYLDANPTYGNYIELAKALRENNGTGAKLSAGPFHNEGLYPLPEHDQKNCSDGGSVEEGEDSQYCFFVGDSRSHVVPTLSALITMFMREHNRIVDELAALQNPGWDEEILYQEARKIVIAEYQMFSIRDLTANVVLDPSTAAAYNLNEKDGYDNVYDDTIDPQVAVQFSTASYRFGHSLINKFHGQYDKDNTEGTLDEPLHRHYFRVQSNFRGSGMNGVLRYIGNKGMKPSNGQLSDSVRQLLFLNVRMQVSLDLASLNIMRGRDHGLPDYNSWRDFCGLARFPAGHTDDIADDIRRVYDNRVDEIDLFAGAMTEKKRPGALVGDLFACLIGKQFQRTKLGDRFYYQNAPDGTTFKGRFKTEEQVKSLQKMTLARVLCETTDTTQVQPNVFRRVSERNPLTPCTDTTTMPDIDFTLWKESA